MPKTWGVGLVGYGLAGRVFHGPLIKATTGLKIAGVVTGNPEREAAARSAHPEARVHAKVESLLEDNSVDVVVVGTPHDSHRAITLQALAAGKHVVVDKLMALSAAEADDMIHAAQKAKRLLTVFQNRRWDSDFLTVQNAIRKGLLGDLWTVESSVTRPTQLPFKPVDPAKLRWRETQEHGGGPFRDWGAHLFDQAKVLFGDPSDVFCDLLSLRPDLGVETAGYARLSYPKGPRVAVEMGAFGTLLKPRWFIRGSLGTLKIEGLDLQEENLAQGRVTGGTDSARIPRDRVELKLGSGSTASVASADIEILPGNYLRFYENIRDVLDGKGELAVRPEECRAVLALFERLFSVAWK